MEQAHPQLPVETHLLALQKKWSIIRRVPSNLFLRLSHLPRVRRRRHLQRLQLHRLHPDDGLRALHRHLTRTQKQNQRKHQQHPLLALLPHLRIAIWNSAELLPNARTKQFGLAQDLDPSWLRT
jgi:hypothetical protein